MAAELKFIDGSGVKTKEDNEIIKPVVLNEKRRKTIHEIRVASENDETSNEDKEEVEKNDFIDDEAEEVSNEDSMDEEERQYIKDNEIIEHGISLGSDDTDESHSNADSDGNDSFIVSDNDEDDDILSGSEDDLSNEKKIKKSRIIPLSDSSDENDVDHEKAIKSSSLNNENIEAVVSPEKPTKYKKLNKSLNDIGNKVYNKPSQLVDKNVQENPVQKGEFTLEKFFWKLFLNVFFCLSLVPIEQIINKCDSFINKLNEAKKEQKLANKQVKVSFLHSYPKNKKVNSMILASFL